MANIPELSVFAKAKGFLNDGYSVIPIDPKTDLPAIAWEEFQRRKSTEQELESWFGDQNIQMQIGIVTGSVSNLIVLESCYRIGGSESVMKLKLPTTRQIYSNAHSSYYFYEWHYETPAPTVDAYWPGISIHGESDYIVPIEEPYSGHHWTCVAPLFLTQLDLSQENGLWNSKQFCRSCLKKIHT